MATFATVLGSIVSGTVVLGLAWRYIVQPIRRTTAAGRELAGQVRAAAASSHELAALAGAVTQFVIAFTGRMEDVERTGRDHDERLADLGLLILDAQADIARLARAS